MSEGNGALDWSALVALVVHPTKVLVVEALDWIDRPLSAADLEKLVGGKHSTSAISYHMLSLVRFGVLEPLEKERVRGAWKQLYTFTPAVKP